MLVLTRKLDEVITIGEGVEVKVLSVSGNRVKLGISAPADMAVRRGAGVSPTVAESSPWRKYDLVAR